jgi:hypothetical protein
MTAVVVTTLPPSPTRADPTNFSAKGDALMTAMPQFVTDVNAAGVQISTDSATAATAATNAATSVTAAIAQVALATTQVGLATTQKDLATAQVALAVAQVALATAQANAAAASAASAAALAGAFVGTSTTSLAIGTGSKTFTTQTGEQYTAGIFMTAVSAANGANFMFGQVTSYSGTTLVLNVSQTGGSGTFADWNLSMTGVQGIQGPAGATYLGGTNLTGAVIPTKATVASSATPNVWTANLIDYTGTVTATGFTAAPQAGAYTKLICAAAAPFTAGANMLIDGVASGVTVTCAAGDKIEIEALTTTQFKLTRVKYDGTAQVSTSLGAGGATATTDVTLTSASPGAQALTSPAHGYAFILPDATTCSKGASLFTLKNAGEFPVIIRNKANAILGFIRPGETATVGLADNSTSSGVWACANVEKVGITAQYLNRSLTTCRSDYAVPIVVDSTRTFYAFGGSSSSIVYGVVYDSSTKIWGTPVALLGSPALGGPLKGVLTATNQILVVVHSNVNDVYALVCTLAGTAITLQSTVSSTNSAALQNGIGDLVTLSANTFVIGYHKLSNSSCRVITLSGNTATIGAEFGLVGQDDVPSIFPISATQFISISKIDSNYIYVVPVTVSGTTCTGGTAVTLSDTTSGLVYRAVAVGTRWAVLKALSSGLWTLHLISVSGTTASVAAVTTNTGSGDMALSTSAIAVIGTKLIFCRGSNGSTTYIQTVDCSSATPTVGTPITLTPSAVSGSTMMPLVSSGLLRFVFSEGGNYDHMVAAVDYSSASPVLSSLTRMGYGGNTAYSTPRMGTLLLRNQRDNASVFAGDYWYSVPSSGSLALTACGPTQCSTIKCSEQVTNSGARYGTPDGPIHVVGSVLASGSSANVLIQKVEAAV